MNTRTVTVGVIGGGRVSDDIYQSACELGRLIAQKGAIVVCGGLGGIMEAVSKGAFENDGTVIGIIPSTNKSDANPYTTIIIPSGMGIGRKVTFHHGGSRNADLALGVRRNRVCRFGSEDGDALPVEYGADGSDLARSGRVHSAGACPFR